MIAHFSCDSISYSVHFVFTDTSLLLAPMPLELVSVSHRQTSPNLSIYDQKLVHFTPITAITYCYINCNCHVRSCPARVYGWPYSGGQNYGFNFDTKSNKL